MTGETKYVCVYVRVCVSEVCLQWKSAPVSLIIGHVYYEHYKWLNCYMIKILHLKYESFKGEKLRTQ